MIKKLNFIRPVVSMIIISVVLILLFCNGLVVNAASVSNGGFTYDDDNLVLLSDFYNFNMVDMGFTSGFNVNDYNNSGLNGSFINNTYSSSNKNGQMYKLFDGVYDSMNNQPECFFYSTFNYNGINYNLSDFPYFLLSSDANYCRLYLFSFDPNDINFIYKGFSNGGDNSFSDNLLICITSSLGQGSNIQYDIDFSTSSVVSGFSLPYFASTYKASVSNWDGIFDAPTGTSNLGNDGNYMNRVYNLSNKVKLNYMLYDSEGNMNYENPILNGGGSGSLYPDGSGGAPDNNLVLKNPDFKWNVPKYWSSVNSVYPQETYTGNWGSGTVSFSALLNDYQIDNLDKFDLAIDFYVYFEINGLQSYGSEVSTKKASKFNMDTIYISLSDFYNNGQSVSYNLNTLFDLYLKNANDDSLLSYIEPFKHYYQIDYWDWYINGYVNLVESSDHSSKSGNYIEGYNFISQVSKEYSDNITNNDNPYIPDNEDDIPVKDPEDNQTITNSNGQIVLTNNDNDNITINGNGEVAKDIVNDLIPSDGVGGLSDQLQEHLDSNGWLSVLKSTFPMFGVDFWDMVGTYFLIALGVCVTGFVLRIILDLL